MSLALIHPARGAGAAGLAAALLAGWALVAAPSVRRAVAQAFETAFPAAPTLTVGDMRAHRMELNGQTVLFVEGVLHNAGTKGRKAPGLKLALVGEDGRPVYTWTAKTARPELAAGADVAFQTRLAAPPEKFKSIAITLD